MLHRIVPVKTVKLKVIRNIKRFSVWQLLVFVAIFAGVGGYIIYRSFAASGPNVVATDGPEYNDSMVVGSDGNARISYTNNAGSLVFIHCLDTQCSSKNTALVDSQGGNNHTSISVGADGNARISYVYNNVLKFALCSDPDCTSSVITTVTTDPATTNLSISSGSMSLGSDGNARIIYTTKLAPYGNELKFVRCTNADCSAKNINPVVVPGASGSGAPSNVPSITPTLSLDSNSFGSFAYFEEDYSENPDWVSYIHCSNLDCSSFSSHHVWSDGGPTSTTITQSIANAKGPFGSSQFNQIPDTRYFVVLGSGAVTVHFTYVYRQSLCANQLQVFKVDNASGSINGVLPGSSSWPAAVSSRNPQLVFNEGTSSIGASIDMTFQGGDLLAFRFIGCGTNYYSYEQADPNGQAHLLTYQSTAGQPWQMDWEDDGDYDYNDMAVNITGVQGGTVTGVQGGSTLAAPLEEVSSTIGADGNPDIAFIWERDLSKDSYVRYLHCQDPDCTTSTYTVVDNDDPGSLDAYHNGIALTVGSDNFARLAFTGSYSGQSALKYIRCTSIDCSTKVGPAILVGTNTGHYPSLTLGDVSGAINLPRITYLDMGSGDLEFAGCADIDCNVIGLPVLPPTAPGNPLAQGVSNTQINLSWQASNSSIGIASYKIYENGALVPDPGDGDTGPISPLYIGTTTSTNYQVTGLQPDTGYSFYVVAVDTAGTVSSQSYNADGFTTGAQTPCVSSKTNRCLSGTTFPYASPFGDDPNICTDTSQCRKMTTETCTNGSSSTTTPTLIPTALDQGVDFDIDGVRPGCTYANPNPADTGGINSNNSKSNTRVYAMGNGKIICLAGNPGFDETKTISQTCPGGNTQLGQKEGTWLVYQITSGAAKGLDIYVAEGCTISSNATAKKFRPTKSLPTAYFAKYQMEQSRPAGQT